MSLSTITFRGLELDVAYDFIHEEPKVGIREWVECYKVEYNGCDVTDIIFALDLMDEINEITYNDNY